MNDPFISSSPTTADDESEERVGREVMIDPTKVVSLDNILAELNLMTSGALVVDE